MNPSKHYSSEENSRSPHLGVNSPTERTLSFSSDVFDLGYLLLTCALGNLDLFDTNGFYSLENLKFLLEMLPSSRRQTKSFCCVLHSEEELRRCYCELSPTRKLRDSGPKTPLINNFHAKSPSNQGSNSSCNKKAPFTLLDLLRRNRRHSDRFIDFLCNCLKVDTHARCNTSSLLEHEFVRDDYVSSGPLISISEVINANKGETVEMSNKVNEEHLNRVCEAIQIVLVNREIKGKMTQFASNSVYENQNSREYQKIQALAMEIGVPVNNLIDKFRNEIFKSDYIH